MQHDHPNHDRNENERGRNVSAPPVLHKKAGHDPRVPYARATDAPRIPDTAQSDLKRKLCPHLGFLGARTDDNGNYLFLKEGQQAAEADRGPRRATPA